MLAVKSQVSDLKRVMEKGNITELQSNLDTAQERIKRAKSSLGWMPYIKLVPGLAKNSQVLVSLLDQAEEVMVIGNDLFAIGKGVLGIDSASEEVNLGSISLDQGKIIVGLSESSEEIVKLEDRLSAVIVDLNAIDTTDSLKVIKEAHALFVEKSTSLAEALDKLEMASELLPGLAGYPKTRTYLFLFQNNTELRPSGGFLGSYGVLEIKDGEIVDFFTDDTYNLDKEFRQVITPPTPLAIYNQDKEWTFRDSNWSPDFPVSSEKMLEFYRIEGGRDYSKMDGVVAITPTVVERLLEILGPQKVEGYEYEFTPENFTDSLEEHVELNYKKVGEAKAERKSIIGKLGSQLIDSLVKLPPEKLLKALLVTENSLAEKHIVLYSLNPKEQTQIVAEGWAGEMKNPRGDFVMIADANIASLKSDPKVKRNIDYKVVEEKDRLRSTLTMTYDHQGEFDWKTTRYRTWVRVYVPVGSQLVGVTGNESAVATTKELGKTVYGFFKVIEPGTKESFTVEYYLPSTISKEDYLLYVQKQAGTVDHTLNLDVFGEISEHSLAKDMFIN